MSLWRQVVRGIRALIHPHAANQDADDEIRHYLEETESNLRASGLSPEDARRMARLEIGDATAVRERVREHGWENVVETTISDFRYAMRRLRRSPGFVIVAAFTLASGIGASAAIFSAVHPILIQTLPYPNAQNLMMVWDGNMGAPAVTFGTYREVVERSNSFESLAVMRPLQATLTGVSEPERLDGQYVSANYFRVLGVQPALGRDFEASDDQPWPRAPFVAIISDALWRRRFGADSAIVGRQVTFSDTPVTIIGVLPAEFENVLSPSTEVWSTLQYDPSLPFNGREWGHHLRMVGRLKNGVHPDQARLELDAIARTNVESFPRPPHASLANGFIANLLQDDLTASVKPVLLAVVGAVALLLTIACVNVTNLLLARGAEQRAELSVRAALGASRLRLIRQVVSETLLLSAFGGALGIVVAYAAVDAIVTPSPQGLPRTGAIAIDGDVLVFTLVLTMTIGLLLGVISARSDLNARAYVGMQQSSTRIAGGRQFTRRALVVAQVALAVVLVAGAGLLLRSVQRLFDVPLGFNAAGLLTMEIQTAGRQFIDGAVTNRFFADVLETVRETPGVSAAAFTSQLPLSGQEDVWGVHFESSPPEAANQAPDGYRYAVSPGYFGAMGIALRQGRLLDSRDISGAPFAAVISESFAARRLPGLDPIGQRVRIGPPQEGPWYTVVGVVANVKQVSLEQSRADAIYVTATQWPRTADYARWLVVRAQHDSASLTPAIRRAVRSVDANQPIVRVGTMEERLKMSEARRRFALILFETFGVVALALAAVGVYGLLSGAVTDRTREIGVRSVLGASRRTILGLILRQGMTLAGLGITIGIVVAAIASGALVTLLFGISRLDFLTYFAVAGLLAVVSAVACGIPAWRATRISPSVALRSE